MDAEPTSTATQPGFIRRGPGVPDAFQEEPGSWAWRKSLQKAAQSREQEVRERRDDARTNLHRARLDRRSLRRQARSAKPGPERKAALAKLDAVEREIRTVLRPELRKAQLVLDRCERPPEPSRETPRPPARPALHRPFVRRVLPRRMPLARAAAHRPRARRVSSARDPGGGDSSEGEPARAGSWLSSETWHRLTPGCSGPERLARFMRLPAATQARTWLALARELEEARR